MRVMWASLVAQSVKTLPAVQETQVRSQGWEDPLEKGTATHSSILAWRIPWTVESDTTEQLSMHKVIFAHMSITTTYIMQIRPN